MTEKVKVLHYIRHLDLGGTTKTCQLFFENSSEDIDSAVAFEMHGDHTRIDEFRKGKNVCGGELFQIDSYNDGSEADSLPLQRLIDAYEPDVLHVYRSGYSEFPANHVNVPHIVETNVFGFLDPSLTNCRTLFMSKWLQEYALARWNVNAFAWNKDRFDYVNNPVESPYSDQRMIGLDQDCIWVGRCGRPDNGIYNAVSVNAVSKLRADGYDIRFLVVAPPSNMILDLVDHEIPFKVIEPTVNPLVLSEFYNSVDIYTHARADGETFGVNIAEAMIHGKPVITHVATPSVPGMGVFQSQTELVDHGTTGFIVQNNPDDYAEALRRLIDNPDLIPAMGSCGREKAMREYHVDACVAKLENVYRSIVSNG